MDGWVEREIGREDDGDNIACLNDRNFRVLDKSEIRTRFVRMISKLVFPDVKTTYSRFGGGIESNNHDESLGMNWFIIVTFIHIHVFFFYYSTRRDPRARLEKGSWINNRVLGTR